MSATLPPTDRPPRLNPFSFPSDTTLQFSLFLIFVLCVSCQFYAEFWDSFHNEAVRAIAACTSTSVADILRTFQSGADADQTAALMRSKSMPQLAACMALLRPGAWGKLAGILITVIATGLIYWMLPVLKLRGDRLVPVDPADAPGLHEELSALCRRAGISISPSFVWNPLATGMPVAFGRHGKYYVALSASFIANYLYADRPGFRAIVLHELAHIRNGDVDKTFITIAACVSFFITSFIPAVAIFLLGGLEWHDATWLLVKALLMSGLVLLSGLSVLRVREFYADVRASHWDRTFSNVDRVLADTGAILKHRLDTYLSFHPDGQARRRVLADPSLLFRLGAWNAFGIGIAAGFVVDTLNSLLTGFAPGRSAMMAISVWVLSTSLTPAIVMIFAIGALSIGVWRSAYAATLTQRNPLRGSVFSGVVFALGYVIKDALIAIEYLWGNPSRVKISLAAASEMLKIQLMISVLIVVICWLVCGWIARCASAWANVVVRSRSPRFVLRATVAIALVLMAGMFSWASFSGTLAVMAPVPPNANPFYLWLVMVAPPLFVVLWTAWLFPFASCWFGNSSTASVVSSWVFLDANFDQPLNLETFSPGRALMAGVVAGLLFCVWSDLMQFRSLLPAAVEDRVSAAFAVLMDATAHAGNAGFLMVVAIGVAASLAAAFCALRRGPFNVLYGLCAGSACGGVIAVNGALLAGLDGETRVTATLIDMCVALLCAFFVSITCAVLVDLHQRLFAKPPAMGGTLHQPARELRPWSNAKKAGFAVLCVMVLAGWLKNIHGSLALADLPSGGDVATLSRNAFQDKLGEMYFNGESLPQDDAQAVAWWRKSADSGYADAQNKLGIMYFRGRGVSQNAQIAAHWFERAAIQGHPDAQANLGYLYAAGLGVVKNESTAVTWFKRAAAQDVPFAREQLHALCASGDRAACAQ
ncbi:hypothetical protein WL37_20500 [Burkholderia ubonensis]|uniref:sel1 repeat family protein n=1 Tax=Burkholderia ubonensis TaxID=101571 RepID=UPI000754A0AA|nr:sel1 repeat family protein [Burkholderia ubonensis]KWB64047.1 hypothetical protein WL37_20500 [Burkholderia ubonensis]